MKITEIFYYKTLKPYGSMCICMHICTCIHVYVCVICGCAKFVLVLGSIPVLLGM